MSAADYDVLIVGGGLAGASLACALNRLPYKVGVIEAFRFSDQAQPSFDDRSIALSYGSTLLLDGMGLWSALREAGAAISEIQISERGRLGLTRMKATEERVPALGYVIENRALGAVLAREVATSPGLDWLAPARVVAVETGAEQVAVHYEAEGQSHMVTTRLLVAADGAQSFVRGQLGIEAQQTDYGLSAIVANVQTQLPHNGVAYERFTETGPLAFLPLLPFEHKSRSAIVWTVRHGEVEELLQLPEREFIQRLQQRFGQRLGRIQKVGQRSSYPVSLVKAEQCVAPRAVVVGNAAQSLNPVAGQGFNLALRDVATLLALLAEQAEQTVADAGAVELLEAYASQRKEDRADTIRFTDSLVKLFSNAFTPLAHARAGGLLVADLFEPLRQRFVRQGMGLNGPRRVGKVK